MVNLANADQTSPSREDCSVPSLLITKALLSQYRVEMGLKLFGAEKADEKIYVCKTSKIFCASYIMLRIQIIEGKQCRSNEAAHLYELPHIDLCYLHILIWFR